MTIHLRTPEYTCKNCKTTFIAYKKGIECIRCGKPEESSGEGYEFISGQTMALIYNMNRFGRYVPDAWYTGSNSDQLQNYIFYIFEDLRKNPKLDLEAELKNKEIIEQGENGEEYHYTDKSYYYDLVVAIKGELEKENKKIGWFKRVLNRIIYKFT